MRDNTKDVHGTNYVTARDTKAGDIIRADDGFDCLKANEKYTVEQGPEGLFVRCVDGQHYLDGQLSDDETAYVGFYPA